MEPVGPQLPLAAAATATDPREAAIGRTRTFFVFITGADAGDQESVCFCTEERDWMNLPELVVSAVAEIALRSDVTDYIRLRAVCKPWRVVAKADPMLMGMDPRCFPRNWDIIDEGARREKTRFMHTLTGASIWLKIPPDYGEVIASAEGCLILASGRGCEQKLRLFNPVTRAVADLPAVPCGSKIISAGFIYDGEADADPSVVLCAVDPIQRIVYYKPRRHCVANRRRRGARRAGAVFRGRSLRARQGSTFRHPQGTCACWSLGRSLTWCTWLGRRLVTGAAAASA
ncbi:hypothetical protein ACQ4PT_048915 [Festuca glaucescens]